MKILLSKNTIVLKTRGEVRNRKVLKQPSGIFIQIIRIKGTFNKHDSKTALRYVSKLPEHNRQRLKGLPSMVIFNLVRSPQVLRTRRGWVLGMTYVFWHCLRFLKHSRSHFEIVHQVKEKNRKQISYS